MPNEGRFGKGGRKSEKHGKKSITTSCLSGGGSNGH
jgi:hypothetical protein